MTVALGIVTFVNAAAVQQFLDLAMGRHKFARARNCLHRFFHKFGRLHSPAVIGKACDPGRARGHYSVIISKFSCSLLAFGNGRVRIYPYAGISVNYINLTLKGLGTVGRRIEVWHSADYGIAAPGRSS